MYSTKILIAAVAAVFLVTSMGCASTRTQESTGEYIDDSFITGKVKAAIIGESTLSAAEINVETFKGVVQLSGFVDSAADINTAMRLARTVSGVKDVKNGMNVK
jgi:osmotically-inducible protein OsmY